MKPILTPTAAEVVRCVRETIESVLKPALQGRSEFSYATSATHLLAFVERRLEDEGQILLDEVNYLRGLFPDALSWLATQPHTSALCAAITESLQFKRDADIYPSLRLMSEQLGPLRQHVCDLLLLLQAAENNGRSAAGDELHSSLRRYIAWQLEREGTIVEPAFRGRGPRR